MFFWKISLSELFNSIGWNNGLLHQFKLKNERVVRLEHFTEESLKAGNWEKNYKLGSKLLLVWWDLDFWSNWCNDQPSSPGLFPQKCFTNKVDFSQKNLHAALFNISNKELTSAWRSNRIRLPKLSVLSFYCVYKFPVKSEYLKLCLM